MCAKLLEVMNLKASVFVYMVILLLTATKERYCKGFMNDQTTDGTKIKYGGQIIDKIGDEFEIELGMNTDTSSPGLLEQGNVDVMLKMHRSLADLTNLQPSRPFVVSKPYRTDTQKNHIQANQNIVKRSILSIVNRPKRQCIGTFGRRKRNVFNMGKSDCGGGGGGGGGSVSGDFTTTVPISTIAYKATTTVTFKSKVPSAHTSILLKPVILSSSQQGMSSKSSTKPATPTKVSFTSTPVSATSTTTSTIPTTMSSPPTTKSSTPTTMSSILSTQSSTPTTVSSTSTSMSFTTSTEPLVPTIVSYALTTVSSTRRTKSFIQTTVLTTMSATLSTESSTSTIVSYSSTTMPSISITKSSTPKTESSVSTTTSYTPTELSYLLPTMSVTPTTDSSTLTTVSFVPTSLLSTRTIVSSSKYLTSAMPSSSTSKPGTSSTFSTTNDNTPLIPNSPTQTETIANDFATSDFSDKVTNLSEFSSSSSFYPTKKSSTIAPPSATTASTSVIYSGKRSSSVKSSIESNIEGIFASAIVSSGTIMPVSYQVHKMTLSKVIASSVHSSLASSASPSTTEEKLSTTITPTQNFFPMTISTILQTMHITSDKTTTISDLQTPSNITSHESSEKPSERVTKHEMLSDAGSSSSETVTLNIANALSTSGETVFARTLVSTEIQTQSALAESSTSEIDQSKPGFFETTSNVVIVSIVAATIALVSVVLLIYSYKSQTGGAKQLWNSVSHGDDSQENGYDRASSTRQDRASPSSITNLISGASPPLTPVEVYDVTGLDF